MIPLHFKPVQGKKDMFLILVDFSYRALGTMPSNNEIA
jgi:hypothetical protein